MSIARACAQTNAKNKNTMSVILQMQDMAQQPLQRTQRRLTLLFLRAALEPAAAPTAAALAAPPPRLCSVFAAGAACVTGTKCFVEPPPSEPPPTLAVMLLLTLLAVWLDATDVLYSVEVTTKPAASGAPGADAAEALCNGSAAATASAPGLERVGTAAEAVESAATGC